MRKCCCIIAVVFFTISCNKEKVIRDNLNEELKIHFNKNVYVDDGVFLSALKSYILFGTDTNIVYQVVEVPEHYYKKVFYFSATLKKHINCLDELPPVGYFTFLSRKIYLYNYSSIVSCHEANKKKLFIEYFGRNVCNQKTNSLFEYSTWRVTIYQENIQIERDVNSPFMPIIRQDREFKPPINRR